DGTAALRHMPSLPTRRSSDLLPGSAGPLRKLPLRLELAHARPGRERDIHAPILPNRRSARQIAPKGAARWYDMGAVDQAILETSSEEHTSELQSPCNLVCRLL